MKRRFHASLGMTVSRFFPRVCVSGFLRHRVNWWVLYRTGGDMAVERALLSVFDKTGIVEFARRLAALKIEILSTGGTSKLLREGGVPVKDVSDYTNWPEMLGGRVKTLHPKVHGGLLYRRHNPDDLTQVKEHGITPIDLVVVNLYPFEATAAKEYLPPDELVENIDIGGPPRFRSAPKNFSTHTPVPTPPTSHT